MIHPSASFIKKAVTKEQRDEFRGSKYVQSDMDGIFRQVAEDLKAGLNVLFSALLVRPPDSKAS